MRFSAERSVAIVVVLVLLAAGGPTLVAGQAETSGTAMHIVLDQNGDARWTVSARFSLEDANETAAFDRLAEEHISGESDALSADPYRSAATAASEVTGREMAIQNVTPTADRANGTGEIQLSFVWQNFTRVEAGGERLILGDVFVTSTGTWLPELRADQALVIEFPQGYAVQSSSRALENGSIRVSGPATFAPGQPSATLQRTGPGTTAPGTTGAVIDGAIPSALSAGAALAIILVAGYLMYRRRQPLEAGSVEEISDVGANPPREELLSDEERVLQLLRSEGGRMKQVDIVKETDWSNAKVSQLLSSMAEAELVEKLRIGRENLISLPEYDDE